MCLQPLHSVAEWNQYVLWEGSENIEEFVTEILDKLFYISGPNCYPSCFLHNMSEKAKNLL